MLHSSFLITEKLMPTLLSLITNAMVQYFDMLSYSMAYILCEYINDLFFTLTITYRMTYKMTCKITFQLMNVVVDYDFIHIPRDNIFFVLHFV